jgi:hypothetical protein
MHKKRMHIVAALLTVTVLFVGPVLGAPRLFGTIGKDGQISTLLEVDPTTGALLQTIGSVGYSVNALTYDAATGKLYGCASWNDPNYFGLLEIDLTTGAGTPVGLPGWGIPDGTVARIAANASGDMYGWWEPGDDDLLSINKGTGVATLVGESGLDTWGLGLAFDNSGVLWMYNGDGAYYTINTATGTSTYVGDLGVTAHHGQFNPDTDLYVGLSEPWGGPARQLVVLDLHNGSVVSSTPTVDGLQTLAWVHGPNPIPEPALIQLPFLMGLGGVGLYWRRRRTA